MEIFGQDMVIGDFQLSNYGLMLASFDTDASSTEEELGMDHETIEEYIGHNPVPIYLGTQYSNKLQPQATIIKNPCMNTETSFTEHECREILRQLTGYRGYKIMQMYSDEFDELLYFNVRINNVSYYKVNGNIEGIILFMECDSQFAWSKEYESKYNVSAGNTITFYNASDDLYNYLLPTIVISSTSSIDQLEIINQSDENWTTTIDNIAAQEVITMDSKNEILTSSIENRLILNDFNMHFIRFVSGKNILQVNADITFTIKCRLPRKVGFV